MHNLIYKKERRSNTNTMISKMSVFLYLSLFEFVFLLLLIYSMKFTISFISESLTSSLTCAVILSLFERLFLTPELLLS